MEANNITQEYRRNKIHPKKFALWIACASMGMVFAALTSAYMVREAGGNWLEFPLPNIFFISTIIILASSVTLQSSYAAYKKENEKGYKGLLLFSLILGFSFVIMQYQGWVALHDMGVPLKLNPAGDFIYAISGIHLAHIFGGLVAMIIGAMVAFSMSFKVTPARKLRFELLLTYWHFVGGLWLYLMIFWTLQRS